MSVSAQRADHLQRLIRTIPPNQALTQISRQLCEMSLVKFIETAWPYLNNGGSEFKPNWHIYALCEHLEAVSRGEIRRLVLNLPPRSLKSIIVSVCWPMWTWAQNKTSALRGPQVKFLCASYNQDLSWNLSTDSRRLALSPFYQERWGHRFKLTGDQNTKTQFDNTKGGSRIATSVGGSLLGIGGNILILDDPHNIEVLSEVERLAAIEWFKEYSSTRFNDPSTGALVVVMQRLHEEDITGYLQQHGGDQWEYLVLPMEFDSSLYQVPTSLGFLDPRGLTEYGQPLEGDELKARDGELLHEERVPREEVERLKEALGPYLASGRLQQRPVPAGGAIIREEWWQLYRGEGFPPMGTIVASLDGAFTEKEENDPSALTIWGVFAAEDGSPKLMLMDAWERRLAISELVQATALSCQKHRVDALLIEAKASGHSAAQEIQRLYGFREWQTILINPKGDKVARVQAIVPLFANGMIYAPDREYAEKVIRQSASFPKAAHDDLVDSCSMAISWLRANGTAITKQEFDEDEKARRRFKKKSEPLYDV